MRLDISVFFEPELVVNVTKHTAVPKHRLLSPKEKKQLLLRFKVCLIYHCTAPNVLLLHIPKHRLLSPKEKKQLLLRFKMRNKMCSKLCFCKEKGIFC